MWSYKGDIVVRAVRRASVLQTVLNLRGRDGVDVQDVSSNCNIRLENGAAELNQGVLRLLSADGTPIATIDQCAIESITNHAGETLWSQPRAT